MNFLKYFSKNKVELRKLTPILNRVSSLEEKIKKLSDTDLKALTPNFKERLERGESLDAILPEAYAAVREASVRTLGMRHYDVQILGGIVLHQGRIAEMVTGEGKTLSATLPVYLNALTGKGVHVVTVNDYLAKRDAEWMGPLYEFMGMNYGSLQQNDPNPERKKVYLNDIAYGTNSAFGFDYLRDNMVYNSNDKVQRGHVFAIVDEVDSILIDEARTPLIISGPPSGTTGEYETIRRAVSRINDGDVEIEEKSHSVVLNEKGVDKIQKILNLKNLFDFENAQINQKVSQALKAQWLYQKERDYIVKEGQIIIVDEFTGRLMFGRRYGDGLHQAIEAKEKVPIRAETLTVATITIQNYFRLYDKLSGMTGTAKTEEREFIDIYNMDVASIPTNQNLSRKKLRDEVYKSQHEKFKASIQKIRKSYDIGQPVLVGTVSIENSEKLSKMLKKEKIPHNVLNAKHHEKEANIVAQAGRYRAVTIATNMAGRGTDILLGGNPEFLANDFLEAEGYRIDDPTLDQKIREKNLKKATEICQEESEKVISVGGLKVLGTERHEARRIDNQLIGRSGRQGDPGSSEFLLSLEDDIMRRFAVDRVEEMMNRFQWPENEALFHPLLDRMIENVQKRIEGHHYEVRKSLLKYDDVLNEQRKVIYAERENVLSIKKFLNQINGFISEVINNAIDTHASASLKKSEWNIKGLVQDLSTIMPIDKETLEKIPGTKNLLELIESSAKKALEKRTEEIGSEIMEQLSKWAALRAVDKRWMNHLTDMSNLRDGVSMRGYGRVDPLTVYAKEAFELFNVLVQNIQRDIVQAVFMAKIKQKEAPAVSNLSRNQRDSREKNAKMKSFLGEKTQNEKKGRNEPCPCGSGKKYKKCCMGK